VMSGLLQVALEKGKLDLSQYGRGLSNVQLIEKTLDGRKGFCLAKTTVPQTIAAVGTYSKNLDWICNAGIDLYMDQNFIRIGSNNPMIHLINFHPY